MVDHLRKGSVVKHLVVPRAKEGRRNLIRRSCPQSPLLVHLSQVHASHSDHLSFDTDKPRNHLRLNSHLSLSRICLLQNDGQERSQSLFLCDKGAQDGSCCQLPIKSFWRGNWWQTAATAGAAFPASISVRAIKNGFASAFHIIVPGWLGHRILTFTDRRRKLNPPHANHHCCSLSVA